MSITGTSIIRDRSEQARIRRAAKTATEILQREDPKQGVRVETDRGTVYIAHACGHYVVTNMSDVCTEAQRFGMDVWGSCLRLSMTREGEEPESTSIPAGEVRSIAVGRGDADTWEGLDRRVLYEGACRWPAINRMRSSWS